MNLFVSHYEVEKKCHKGHNTGTFEFELISNKSGWNCILTINKYNDGMNFHKFIENSQETRQKIFN